MNRLVKTAIELRVGLERHFQNPGAVSLFVGFACNLAFVGHVYFFPALWHTSALAVSYTDVTYVGELIGAVALLVFVRRGGLAPSSRLLWIAAILVQATLAAYCALFEMGISVPPAMDWICGAVFGLYVPLSMLCWLQVHARLRISTIVWNIMLSAAFGSFVIWVFTGLAATKICVCMGLMLLVATAVLARRMRGEKTCPPVVPDSDEIKGGSVAFRYPSSAVLLFSFAFVIAVSFAGTRGSSALFSTGAFFAPLVIVCALVLLLNFSSFPLTNIAVPAIVTATIAAATLNVEPALSFDLAALGMFLFLAYAVVLLCVSLRGKERAVSAALLRLMIAFSCGCIAGRVAMALCAVVPDLPANALVLLSILAANAAMVVLIRRGATPRRSRELFDESETTPDGGLSATECASATRVAAERNLGEREKEVLVLLLKGKSASEIASALVIANGTAKSHIRHVYKKLGVHSRAELFACVGVEAPTTSAPSSSEGRPS